MASVAVGRVAVGRVAVGRVGRVAVLLRVGAGAATSAGMIGIQLVARGFVGLAITLYEPGALPQVNRAGRRLYRPWSSATSRSAAE